MTGLRIAADLTLDPDYVGAGAVGILAKRGAGKSYLGRVLAEEFWAAGVPFVAVDPMSAWWGLRSDADGDGPGLPIPILGGAHGDVPLERTSGAVIADLIVDERLSAIVDLSDLGSHAAERQFMREFLDRLYRRNDELRHLLIDEADLLAPQKPQPGDQPLLGVMQNIVRRGRPRGIGCTLITQRPAVLNKDVLSQVDGLVAMRLTGSNDRKAIDDWVSGHADPEAAAQVKQTLASLATGEAWVWVPEIDVLSRVQVRRLRTFDSSATRTRGPQRTTPRTLADIDLTAIRERMAETIDRAESENPERLRARIRELENERPEPEQVWVDVPVLSDAMADEIRRFQANLARFGERLQESAVELGAKLDKAIRTFGEQVQNAELPDPPALPPKLVAAPRAVTPTDGQFRPSGSQQRILDALAALDTIGVSAPVKNQLALFAEAKPTSGGYRNNLSTLRTAGLIDYPEPSHVVLTDTGRGWAAPTPDLATTTALHAYVRRMVGEPRWRILAWLVEIYPKAIEKYELAARIEVQPTSGGYRNNLSTLRTLGLIEYPTAGWVKASSVLMLEAAA